MSSTKEGPAGGSGGSSSAGGSSPVGGSSPAGSGGSSSVGGSSSAGSGGSSPAGGNERAGGRDGTGGRSDGRADDAHRRLSIQPGFIEHAEGSVLIEMGRTRVICTASVEEGVPGFLKGRGTGWVTAEYGMLPRSTHTRNDREAARGKVGGRTMEIQRLIGRSIRAAMDMRALGERTVKLDCDVIQADGGTRTASITGAWIALALACRRLERDGLVERSPVTKAVAAISVGIVDGRPLMDLAYDEDSRADVDMNVVMTSDGEFVEVQGTGEGGTFRREQLDELTDLAWKGIQRLIEAQKKIVG